MSLLVVASAAAALLLAAQAAAAASVRNPRPIIGLMTQPSDGAGVEFGSSYVPASYVKWLEAGGARVVPLHFDYSEGWMADMLTRLDGVVFPGGDLPLNQTHTVYYQRLRQVLAHAKKFELGGDESFVVWGTCQGFQQLAILTGGESVWGYFELENKSVPLEFAAEAHASRLFGRAPAHIYKYFATLPITENLHHEGVSPDKFVTNAKLRDEFTVLSTNKDLKGVPFTSSFEAKKHDIYATQFHPERNAYEFNADQTTAITHSLESVEASQWLANFLVNVARGSTASLKNPPAPSAFIGNSNPVFTEFLPGFIDSSTYFWK